MAFPKDPIITTPEEVVADERKRQRMRSKLFGEVEIAREVLTPRYQYRRWMDRNKAEAREVGKAAVQTTKKAAPVIGALGIGTLLFLNRKPISKWISQLRNSKTKPPDDK